MVKAFFLRASTFVSTLCFLCSSAFPQTTSRVVDFEDFAIGSPPAFYGPTENAITRPDNYGGTSWQGTIEVGGVHFSNKYSDYYWSGFAISNGTDTSTEGWTNQFSSITGSGANGSQQYAVASGYHDTISSGDNSNLFNPINTDHLKNLPSFYLSEGTKLQSFSVTNTTYAALSMLNGDGVGKKFGGETGNDPDYFLLNIYGMDSQGVPLEESLQIALADFTQLDATRDYILQDWVKVDVSSMSEASSFHFNVVSSDSGPWGMNTPAYFAIDDLQLASVPEPTTLVLCGVAGLTAFGARRFRRKGSNREKLTAEESMLV